MASARFASLDSGVEFWSSFLRQVRYFGDGQPRSFRDFVNRQNVKQGFLRFRWRFWFFGLFDRFLVFPVLEGWCKNNRFARFVRNRKEGSYGVARVFQFEKHCWRAAFPLKSPTF